MKIYRATVSARPHRETFIGIGDILAAEVNGATRYFRGIESDQECYDCPVNKLSIKVGPSVLSGCYALDFICASKGFREINQREILEDLI